MKRDFLPAMAGYMHLPRLDALFSEGLEYPMVLVVAGPGYGKTLSLAWYLDEAPVRLAWVRVAEHRGSAADFWEDYIGAAGHELPEYARKLEGLGFPGTVGSFESFRQLMTAEAAAGPRMVLVVDNYEYVQDVALQDFFDKLIDSDVENFTLFMLCNTRLSFAGTLPARGQLRITDADLAFTADEAVQLFESDGVPMPREAAEAAMRETGGWPMALRLKSALYRAGGTAGADPYEVLAAELFERHYYRDYPEAVRTKLVRFSLLPGFSLEMAAEDGAASGELYRILQQHPFTWQDLSVGLYVFQPMYHAFLRKKRDTLSAEARRETHAAGARWFMEHGMISEAVDGFWHAGDYDRMLEAVARLPKIRHRISLTNSVLRRLEQIPQSYAATHPEVDYGLAFMYLNAAEVERAKALFLKLEARLLAEPDSRQAQLMLGDIYATLADIGLYLNDDTAFDRIKQAWRLIPQGSRAHSPQLMALGNNSALYLPDNTPGQLQRMTELFMSHARYWDDVMNGNGYGYEYLYAGEAAYARGDMDKAANMLSGAVAKAQAKDQHDIVCNALWGLMRIPFFYGNHKDAMTVLRDIEDYVNEREIVALYELRDCATAWVWLNLGDRGRVPARFAEDMAEQEEQPVAIGRNRLVAILYLLEINQEERAYAVMEQMEKLLGGRGRWMEKLYLYILKATRHLALGDDVAFLEAFGRAYGMAYANDIRLPFVELREAMAKMVEALKRLAPMGYDMAWLSSVQQDALSYSKRLQTMRHAHAAEAGAGAAAVPQLTHREDEVLNYLAQGLTQQQMSEQMGISGNAVKKHVAKLYQKLGATNRADAIHIASIGGLVDIINE